MAKRSTIGRDPFADAGTNFSVTPETNVVALSTPAIKESAPRLAAAESIAPEPRIEIIHIDDSAARRAVGGRLEIFGGDLGAGISVIWRHGPDERIGFVAPNGRLIDLADELAAAPSWQDRTEHRVLSTLGWAWVIGSLGGVLGIVAGGGLRLLSPRRMIVQMRLADGSKLVARTDSITVSGLAALVGGTKPAKAAAFFDGLAARFHQRSPSTA